MDLGLCGKVAVVTGASRGIGLAVTRALVAEGGRVAAGARTGSAELAALEREHPDRVRPVRVDLTEPDGPARLVAEAVGAFGGLDVLVNNVGAVRPRLDGFLAVTDDDWAWSWGVNFLPAVRAIRAALPHLLDRAPATIVTVASVNAFLPDPGVIDYSAAKGALANLSKALSKEFGPRGIRVNTVSPGPVETDLWLGEHGVARSVAGAGNTDAGSVVAQQAAAAATGRFTRPEEVADLVALLAGGRAGNVTGADVVIDGGLVTTL
ncbi:SDR family NAD(P)-dependent oxidoreductase [Pseudonocardia lacus]|uniref:SDR family NAD(P)-dependent oxidoreductase n=1 Tax=Pseudonocardia lacus TaxID=2835865 RepID=UPI001BDD79FE|nr:SDR family oxidoreductase [Pseudonocardia lacus]